MLAPCRLHFGLMRFGVSGGQQRSYGGLGLMVKQQRVVIEVARAKQWSTSGPHGERVIGYAQRVTKRIGEGTNPLQIAVSEAPREHIGLGVGTQLALSTAAGVLQLFGHEVPPVAELAQLVGRGNRSAVGAHGFEQGGLILENGFTQPDSLGELTKRVGVPREWRFVLATIPTNKAIHGLAEQTAFDEVPAIPETTTATLLRLAIEEILPAAERNDCERFGAALYEYGYRAGECFKSVQGGAYATKELAVAVARLRELGVQGVGQSSWGPTLYAVVENSELAEELLAEIGPMAEFKGAVLQIIEPNNRGASFTRN
ncbi:GHMP family kinase ATP-binding protein [Adhaeretor mobilis]|uniref:Uncharacterized protein n=1 Tax=Adhaeretor mobilis TaxID=1930276 RepID=A0A517MWA1_9BACT|nr:hypothetical protein [Adhaeretor mobilis]QDS99153.1 hypothetical protein HG15A2_24450 [Adhaeretor mobilis]